MEKFAVIVAGGSGTRMGAAIPKQFLEIGNEALIVHTARAFVNAFADIRLVLVFPEAFLDNGRALFNNFNTEFPLVFLKGGTTRFHSVYNGLSVVTDESVVFIHDAVRCLISAELIRNCYEHALINDSAIPVVPVRDSLRLIQENGENIILDREKVRAVQTPQTFKSGLIKSAFNQPYQSIFTDEASVLEYAGHKLSLIAGDENNIKVTYPADLILAENILLSK